MQCGSYDSQPYVNLSSEMARALRQLGHDVDFRAVRVHEPLDYDFAFIGLSSLVAFSAQERFGAMWAAINCRRAVYYHDDWRFPDSWSNFKAAAVDRTQSMSDYTIAAMRELTPSELRIMKAWVEEVKAAQHPVMIGAYAFGDLTRMKYLWPCKRAYGWDPSSLMEPQVPAPGVQKRRQWFCGTLSNQQKWLDKFKFTWPVYRLFKAVGMTFSEQVPESEFFARHCVPNWGHLCYQQKNLGSLGFWRPRHHHAMWAGQVVYADPREVHRFGSHWTKTIRDIESLTDDALLELAHNQRAAFEERWISRDESLSELQSIIDKEMTCASE